MNIHSRKNGPRDLGVRGDSNAGPAGPGSWRSLEELADTEPFRAYLHREFPEQASEWTDEASRRTFLKLMGASLALAGVAAPGCDPDLRLPPEKILPYVRQPENLVPGQPLTYATAVSLGGFGTGVLAESHMGRPTMLEGNPEHPDSLGSLGSLSLGTLLALYDPDRSQVVLHNQEISTFDGFILAAVEALESRRDAKGAGVRILTETVTSPSLARMIGALRAEYPEAKWHQYEPAGRHSATSGARLAFGRDVGLVYDTAKADVILCLDADPLAEGPGHLAFARGFGLRRDPNAAGGMNRLYAVEPTLSVTGSNADHRLRLRAREVPAFAMTLARKLGLDGVPEPPAVESVSAASLFLDALVKDLDAHKGASLVVTGEGQPPYVHALVLAINAALGNLGKSVKTIEPVEAEPVDQPESLSALCRDMAGGDVAVLMILGGNPAYTAPVDSGFVEGLAKVKFKVRLGHYEDETSALCDWHVPEAHELETWGDVRGTDGTATIQQPLIAPLFGGRSALELLAALLKDPRRSGYEIVRETWRKRTPDGRDFETFWRTSVHDGVVAGTQSQPLEVTVKTDLGTPPAPPPGPGEIEALFRPDPTVWDGRFANVGWLQELPKPISKLTWDNAATVSPTTAERLGLAVVETTQGADVVELTLNGRHVEAPVLIQPGHADDSITLHLGYGRQKVGRVGQGAGFNAYALRTAEAPSVAVGLQIRKLDRSFRLATTQSHHSLEGRDLYRQVSLEDLVAHKDDPHFAEHLGHAHAPEPEQSLITVQAPDHKDGAGDYQWGMVVNLNACIGCSACVLACVAENNIPVVGREQVRKSREMHWLEIDRYYAGEPEDPDVYHQPRLCMHCEKAPCEVVCPVAATLHDTEGLNLMVYNRCVGTRYCSNNCPYKVRHFNFLQYADLRTPSLGLLNNPDVSVRVRGVMEKCTYCVQRINEVRYKSELEDRRIRDGEVVTACQSSCPTQAITFGDVSDPESAVSKLRGDHRNYGMLAELNTRPRTTYLLKIRNPNPALETGKTEPRHGV
ncbi:MAG: TAT-variant-translocated molybdopterin oxidoreductase [Isosphaeraceae bacterium]